MIVIMYKIYDHAFVALCILAFWCNNFKDLVYMNFVFCYKQLVLHFACGVYNKYFGVALYYCILILEFIVSIFMHFALCFWVFSNC